MVKFCSDLIRHFAIPLLWIDELRTAFGAAGVRCAGEVVAAHQAQASSATAHFAQRSPQEPDDGVRPDREHA